MKLLAIKKLWGICLAVPAILGNMGCPLSFNPLYPVDVYTRHKF